MKVLNSIISALSGLGSVWVMFFQAHDLLEFTFGFILLLTAVLFLCFVMLEEQKEEVERLRQIIMKYKGLI